MGCLCGAPLYGSDGPRRMLPRRMPSGTVEKWQSCHLHILSRAVGVFRIGSPWDTAPSAGELRGCPGSKQRGPPAYLGTLAYTGSIGTLSSGSGKSWA